jgi:hypothetical protein
MLRQDQGFEERAAFRGADGTRIARSFLALLARRRTAFEVFLTALIAGTVGFLIAYLGWANMADPLQAESPSWAEPLLAIDDELF